MNKKRFIAAAVCPKCQAKDSIYIQLQQGMQQIHCTECDFQQRKPLSVDSDPQQIITRIALKDE